MKLGSVTISLALFAVARATEGTFSVGTYNIAGLIEGVSSAESPRSSATAEISTYVNPFDIVGVQEDFNYHTEFYESGNTHRFRTPHTGGMGIGSGLNLVSNFIFRPNPPVNVRWGSCAISDCLTPKGFSFTEVQVADDVFIHVYNFHGQSGGDKLSLEKRIQGYAQKLRFIKRTSGDHPILLIGDFNSRYTDRENRPHLDNLIDFGFQDTWIELVRVPNGLSFPEGGRIECALDDPNPTRPDCEHIDKILFKSNGYVTLTPVEYNVRNDSFTSDGLLLSDHPFVTASFNFVTNPTFRLTRAVGGVNGGDPFHDSNFLVDSNLDLVAVRVNSGKRLLSIQSQYADDTLITRGRKTDFNKRLFLDAGEFFVSGRICKARAGWRKVTERVAFLRLETSNGRRISAGKNKGDCENFEEIAGFQIVGFHGRSGEEVDSLGFIYKAIV